MLIKTELGTLEVRMPISCLTVHKTKIQAEIAAKDLYSVVNNDKHPIGHSKLMVGELDNSLGFVIFWVKLSSLTKPRTATLQKSSKVPNHVDITGEFLGEKSWSVKKSS
jgi:hypothetical protein